METKWHLRARAVLYRDGRFLIAHPNNPTHTFLMGGHVEIGESVTTALEREVMEESGRKCEVGEYLGAIENAWIQDGVRQWEITHFFHVIIPDLEEHPDVLPAEDGFDFIWITPDEFEKHNFLPMPLRDFMKSWANGDKGIWWASTMR